MIFRCKRCTKLCSTYNMMVYHSEKTCLANKEYPCTECNYVASWSDALKRHILHKHTYIDPTNYHKCNTCDKSFRLIYSLKLHQKYCNIQPKFICDQCPFKSKFKKSMESHKRSHIQGGPVKRKFSTKTHSFNIKKRKISPYNSMYHNC